MLGRLTRELPADGWLYEPKWDGFRCLAFRDGDEVDLRSRHDRPFARYFPEVVEALVALGEERFVLDGEVLVPAGEGFDFPALMLRLHPAASRVEQLAREHAAVFVVFDLLRAGADDLVGEPFAVRRERLEALVGEAAGAVRVTPQTADRSTAEGWLGAGGRAGGGGGRRRDSEAAGRALPARRAGDAEGQARADGRLRRGGVPRDGRAGADGHVA